MKKFWVMLCVLVLSLSLAACGDKDKDSTDGASSEEVVSTAKTDADDVPLIREDDNSESSTTSDTEKSENATANVATILADPSTFNKSNLSQEQLDAIEQDAKENGYTYEWDADGYLVITESNGDTIAWNSKWEKNEFTEQVPAPKEEFIVASQVEDTGYAAMLAWTLEDAEEYGEKIKNAGFDQDVTSMDTESMYMYLGINDEYMVTVTWGAGEGTNGALSISRK